MKLWVILLTALTGFGAAAVSGKYLIPLLRRMRYIPQQDTGSSDNIGRNIPIGGGAMLAVGVFIGSAAGFAVMKFISDSLAFDGSGYLLYFIGQGIMLLSAAAGFYSDTLRSGGRRDGIGIKGAAAYHFVLAAAFLTVSYMCGGTTEINIPLLQSYDLGAAYYPVMLIYMTIIPLCIERTDRTAGAMPAETAVFSTGMIMLLSYSGMNEYSILSAAAAGGCMGFMIWGFPPPKTLSGRTGSMLMGSMAAVMAAVSGQIIIMTIMLIPSVRDGIKAVIRSSAVNSDENKAVSYNKNGAVTAMRYFIAAVVSSAAGIAVFLMAEKS